MSTRTSEYGVDAERLEAASEWLQRLQDAPQDETVLADWLQWCDDPRNHDAFDRVSAVWRALDTPTAAAALRRPTRSVPAHPRRRRQLRVAALAAGLAACGIVSLALLRDPQAGQRLAFSTGRGENKSELLSDGSRIELGALSRVEVRYTPGHRDIVLERGEAYFKVAKDHARPFVVTAGAMQVTAVGTQFNVRRIDGDTVVTVNEGRVKVEPLVAAGSRDRADRKVDAGEQAHYVAAMERIAVAPVNPEMASSWRAGVLKFVDQPLDDVIADVNRYSHRQIVLDDATASKFVYTGTVYDAQIDEWIGGLSHVFPLRIVRQDADIVVLAADDERRAPATAEQGP